MNEIENIYGLKEFVTTWGVSYKEHSYRYMRADQEYKKFNITIVLKMMDHLADFALETMGSRHWRRRHD